MRADAEGYHVDRPASEVDVHSRTDIAAAMWRC
jgi:hypothetical protein